MHTAIDDVSTKWFLEGVSFDGHELLIALVEGIVGLEQASICVAGREVTTPSLRSVDVTDQSRRFKVVFASVLAHQVIDESFTAWDDYETRDSTQHTITVLARSRYLDFVSQHHGWMLAPPGERPRHFRVWTYDAVIDVVARVEPIVEPIVDD